MIKLPPPSREDFAPKIPYRPTDLGQVCLLFSHDGGQIVSQTQRTSFVDKTVKRAEQTDGNTARRGPDRLLILGGTAAAHGHRGRVTSAHDPPASDGIHQTPRLLPLSPAQTCSDGCDPHPGKERAEIGAVLLSQS